MPRALAPWVLALVVLVALATGAAAAPKAPKPPPFVEALVERAYDGDSLRLAPVDGSATIDVRLSGIDAPERCQEGGAEAHLFLAELVVGRHVRWVADRRQPKEADGGQWGRLYLGDDEVNRRVVEEGHAWSERVKWDRGPYVAQERMARSLRRGLHRSGSTALNPKDFRDRHGPCRQG